MRLAVALTPIVAAFDRLGIVYQIGGSVASSAHGTPRSTLDVDLVADLRSEHVAPLCDALRGDYYADPDLVRDAIARRACANFLHLTTGWKVDVFVLRDGEYDRRAFLRFVERSVAGSAPGQRFRLATAEDVLLRKLQWFRSGGEVSERPWQDVLGLLRVQADALDRAYLHEWAAKLQLDHLLERAEREVFGPAG